MTIIWVNVILSGDNAVVIALAARSLPKHQQGKAVFLGAGAAVILRIILTWFAVELLQLPYLKIIGGLLLFWIAIKLLIPQEEEQNIKGHHHLFAAIKTILLADLVMSVDNVIAVAAAAQGNMLLLTLGLLISIPLVIFGATLLMTLMERYPGVITVGAAMIGWVAGEMLITDPILGSWIALHVPWLEHLEPLSLGHASWMQFIGAAMVLLVGKRLAARAQASMVEITLREPRA